MPFVRIIVRNSRRIVGYDFLESSDVIRRGAAASADHIDQSVLNKVPQTLGHHFRRFIVATERVGQTCVNGK